MNNEELDKLFRDGAQGATEPIAQSDWKAFAAFLGGKEKLWWPYLLGFMVLVGLGGAFYFGEDALYEPRSAEVRPGKGEEISNSSFLDSSDNKKREKTTITENSAELNTNDKGERGETKPVANPTEITKANSTDKESVSENDLLIESKPKVNRRPTGKPAIEEAMNAENSQKAKGSSTDTEFRSATDDADENTKKVPKNVTESLARESNWGSGIQVSDDESGTNSAEGQRPGSHSAKAVRDKVEINQLEVEVRKKPQDDERSQLQTEMELMDLNSFTFTEKEGTLQIPDSLPEGLSLINNKINLIAFAGYERNTVFRNRLEVGLLVAKGFSRWAIYAGVGLRRSSGLSFSESNTVITYGLGRYSSEQRISTTELNTLIVPLKLGYRIGGLSEIFVAFNPQFVLNAKQEVVQASDFEAQPEVIETGYFTDLKDHNFDYSIQLGYAHNLNEFMKMEIGASYNPQQWRISENHPTGGFVRFNYIIR